MRSDRTGPGQIFAATDVGLYRVDQAADQVVLVTEPFRQNPQVAANIRDLSIQADGSFWIGLWGDGVIHWDPAANTSTTYLQPEIRHKTGDAVQAMLVSGDDTWVGTRYSGVFRIRHENGQVEHFSEAAANKLTLPSQDVQCLEHGPAATLLICTQQGLVVYDPQTDTQHLLDERSGLPTSNIIGAYADQQQNIWLLSAKGLSLKHSDSQRLITFTRQDGLVATEQVFKSFFDDQQGSFYIGSIEGLTLMEPAVDLD